MRATKTARSTISREKFTLFVSGLLDRYPNPESDPQRQAHGIHSYDRHLKRFLDRIPSRGGYDSNRPMNDFAISRE